MNGVQSPTAVVTHRPYGLQHDFSLFRRDGVGRLTQMSPLNEGAFGIRIGQAAPICMVQPVDGPLLIPMEMVPVTGKRNEVGHDARKSVS
jgi:hypothetical protein